MTDLSPETVETTPPDDPRADDGLVEAMAEALWLVGAEPENDNVSRAELTLTPWGDNLRIHARAALTAARSHGGM